MATDITVNTTKSTLSIAFDKTDYPDAKYSAFIDLSIANLDMQKGAGVAPVVLIDQFGTHYSLDVLIGTGVTVATVAAVTNLALRTAILAAI